MIKRGYPGLDGPAAIVLRQKREDDIRLTRVIEEAKGREERLLAELPERLRRLARLGWYLTMNITPWATEVITGSDEEGDEAIELRMESWANGQINERGRRILQNHPKRAPIISDALDAHSEGKFNLSVPIFLAQADGICREFLGVNLFSAENTKGGGKVPRTLIALQRKLAPTGCFVDRGYRADCEFERPVPVNRIADVFLQFFRQPTSISAGMRELPNVAFNRHEVLHGISTDYGTLRNSLKAFVCLDYVDQMRDAINNHTSSVENYRKIISDGDPSMREQLG